MHHWNRLCVVQEELFEEIAATGAQLMGAMCPRDIAKLMYSLGRVQAGDREFAAAARPYILAHLDHFTYNVRARICCLCMQLTRGKLLLHSAHLVLLEFACQHPWHQCCTPSYS